MSDTTATTFLQNHPKMIGALFTMMLLLGSSGTAAACTTSSCGW